MHRCIIRHNLVIFMSSLIWQKPHIFFWRRGVHGSQVTCVTTNKRQSFNYALIYSCLHLILFTRYMHHAPDLSALLLRIEPLWVYIICNAKLQKRKKNECWCGLQIARTFVRRNIIITLQPTSRVHIKRPSRFDYLAYSVWVSYPMLRVT